jgi:hypothetical protein
MKSLHKVVYDGRLLPNTAVEHDRESADSNVVNDAPTGKLVIVGAERDCIAAHEFLPVVRVARFVVFEVRVAGYFTEGRTLYEQAAINQPEYSDMGFRRG